MTPPDTPRPVSTPETGRTAEEIAREIANRPAFNGLFNGERLGLREAIAAELAPILTSAQEENAGLRARIAKYQSRLEIDHIGVLVDGEIVPRVVPENERDDQIDGITARDATIELQDERIAELEAANAGLRAEKQELLMQAIADFGQYQDNFERAEKAEAALATARQEEREECAKMADAQLAACGTLQDAEDPPYTEGKQDAYHDMAVRIRSRSSSSPSTPTGTVSDTGGEGWRPIETAPKDGTLVLLFDPSDDDGETIGVWRYAPKGSYRVAGWENGRDWMAEDVPTAWAPLPAPPADERVTDIAEEPGR